MNPTVSYFMLLGGMLIAYIEFVRPGWVAPGVVGGVVAIWGLARLWAIGLNWEPVAVFLLGAVLLVVQAWFWKRGAFRTSWIGGIGVLSMSWGSVHLVRMPLGVDPLGAEFGVVLFALVTVPMLAMAFRAKRNKAVA